MSFADIGVRDPEESRVQADLARKIAQLIKKRGLRQVEVAKILGVDQTEVSKPVRGRISRFTSDRLFRYLEALGRNRLAAITSAKLSILP